MSKIDLILQGYEGLEVEDTVQELLKHLSDSELFKGFLNEAVAATPDMPAELKVKIAAGEIKHGQELQKELADLKEGIFASLKLAATPTPLAPLEVSDDE
eukprot:2180923-Pyramimonas_sp.AAC.2